MSFTIGIIIVVLFVAIAITINLIIYFVCSHSNAAPPLQPAQNTETRLSDTTLDNLPRLTYAEAKRRDPQAATIDSCSICLGDYNEEEEEGEDPPLRLLPDCGHFFHAVCLDSWLLQHRTCPLCRSPVMNVATQTPPLADAIPPLLPLEIDQA